jgi:hypothetical protein
MRVDDRHVVGSQAVQSGKTSNMQEVERLSESRPPDSRAGVGADRVELSDLTGGLVRALGRSASERASRMERLAQEYGEGRYQAHSLAVSRAILDEMRAAGNEAIAKQPGPPK